MKVPKKNKPVDTPANANILKDRPSGVTKTIEGISPLLCAKAPTLDCPDHRVEFNTETEKMNRNTNIFIFFQIYFTN